VKGFDEPAVPVVTKRFRAVSPFASETISIESESDPAPMVASGPGSAATPQRSVLNPVAVQCAMPQDSMQCASIILSRYLVSGPLQSEIPEIGGPYAGNVGFPCVPRDK
jgi:hypothetical protein